MAQPGMDRKFSLRPPWPVSYFLALSIIALAVPLLVLLGMEAARLTTTERARLFDETRRTAERIAADLDQTLNGYIAVLESLAATPALAEDDFATVYRQAEAALKSRGLYAFLRDMSGQQLFNTRVPYGTPLPRSTGPVSAQRIASSGEITPTLAVRLTKMWLKLRSWLYSSILGSK